MTHDASGPALTAAEVNHLRRLVAWVACDIGPAPEEFDGIVQSIAPALQDCNADGKARLVEHHQKLASTPRYVRAAVKALRKTIAARPDGIEDAELVEPAQRAIETPRRLEGPK